MESSAERSYSQAEQMPCSLFSEWFRHSVKRFSFKMCIRDRRNSLRAWWWPLRVIRKAADRYYECKTDEELVAELCNRLNPDSPIPDNDIAWMDQILSESNTDLTFEELTKKVIVWPEWHYRKYETGEVRYDGQDVYKRQGQVLSMLTAAGLKHMGFSLRGKRGIWDGNRASARFLGAS